MNKTRVRNFFVTQAAIEFSLQQQSMPYLLINDFLRLSIVFTNLQSSTTSDLVSKRGRQKCQGKGYCSLFQLHTTKTNIQKTN